MAFKNGDKRAVRRFSVEPTHNKGFMVRVEHHPKPRKEGAGAKHAFTSDYVPDENYGHDNSADAQSHVADLMNRMKPKGPGTPS